MGSPQCLESIPGKCELIWEEHSGSETLIEWCGNKFLVPLPISYTVLIVLAWFARCFPVASYSFLFLSPLFLTCEYMLECYFELRGSYGETLTCRVSLLGCRLRKNRIRYSQELWLLPGTCTSECQNLTVNFCGEKGKAASGDSRSGRCNVEKHQRHGRSGFSGQDLE